VGHRAELSAQPGERVFDFALQGDRVLKDFDIVREADGARRAIVREFKGVKAGKALTLSLAPRQGKPLIRGMEIVAE